MLSDIAPEDLCQLREELGVRAQDVAKRMGTSPSTISRIEGKAGGRKTTDEEVEQYIEAVAELWYQGGPALYDWLKEHNLRLRLKANLQDGLRHDTILPGTA